jgi:REP element-mobilizing transposase RayT
MAHTFTNLLVHAVFSTKGREPWLDGAVRPRLLPYMGGIVREAGANAVIIDGADDHVHLLLAITASIAVADLMRVLKTNSSRWVHETFPNLGGFAWQAGYGAFSVSESQRDALKQYIANQAEHHKHVTFQEEFRLFLRRHGIVFDERYVWD